MDQATHPSEGPAPSESRGRRTFLGLITAPLLAVPFLAPLAVAVRSLVGGGKGSDALRAKAVPLDKIPKDEVLRYRLQIERRSGPFLERFDRVVFLRRTSDREVLALSSVCTHLACNVAYNAEEKRFDCPCHKGFFDLDGKVLEGPPPEPLRRLGVTIPTDTSAPIEIEV